MQPHASKAAFLSIHLIDEKTGLAAHPPKNSADLFRTHNLSRPPASINSLSPIRQNARRIYFGRTSYDFFEKKS
ncbi:MAG: hypothetical protein A2Z83_00555 [Omnitrophica bacterium GWA2_52_8]|nr:MAG: hypothetical protein A2Z83_00555 [Omnitrophica bacterium GWA2_52_8]